MFIDPYYFLKFFYMTVAVLLLITAIVVYPTLRNGLKK